MGTELSKKERKKLISRISQASGIAQYALEAKITDEQAVEAAKNLDVLLLVKPANNFNRYCQAEKTAAANAKLQEFFNTKNSEILKAGQWLFNSLSKTGLERKQSLLEKDLVHKDDYNKTKLDLEDVIITQQDAVNQSTIQVKKTIYTLEKRNDNLREQLALIKNYIKINQGSNTWKNIEYYLQQKLKND
jgi:hypothetical protein